VSWKCKTDRNMFQKSRFNGVKNRTVELNRDLILQTLQQMQLLYRFRMLLGN